MQSLGESLGWAAKWDESSKGKNSEILASLTFGSAGHFGALTTIGKVCYNRVWIRDIAAMLSAGVAARQKGVCACEITGRGFF